MKIEHAEDDAAIERCFEVMHELRPALERARFVETVNEMARSDAYRLAYVEDAGRVVAVAGYRVARFLAWGVVLYVDDLVTAESRRSRGYGSKLLAWLRQEARHLGCARLHLDSALWRTDAHRFYERESLPKIAFHFGTEIEGGENR